MSCWEAVTLLRSDKLTSEHKISQTDVRTAGIPQGPSLIEHLFFIIKAILDICEIHQILMGIISSCIMCPDGNQATL